MNNLEEKLNKIKLQKASPDDKSTIWLGIVRKMELQSNREESLSIFRFNYKKHMIGALIALIILGGGGGVVAASNASAPGDALYGLDLAVEKAKLNLVANAEKKDELRIKFADERVAEAKSKTEVKGSANTADIDLSAATITEIEVDVFTNETTVKLEANDKHYGFVTTKKTRADVVAEIVAKYNLTTAKVDAMIDFETEDRASRAEDKGFLNSSNSIEIKSEKEKRDFEMSLQSLNRLGEDEELSAEAQARLTAAINEIRLILEANPNSKIKIENGDFKLEVKENGMIKFKSENDSDDSEDDDSEDDDGDDDDGEDDDKGHGNDDDGKDDDNPGNSTGINVNVGAGANVNVGGNSNDDDSDDDGDDDSDDDDDDDDSDDGDDDSDDDDDDDNNSGSGSDDDNDSDDDDDDGDDDDNSGHGN